MGGRKLYGFTLEPTIINNIKTKKLSPVADEIEHVKYIFDTYAVENITLRRLMDNLVQNNILPPSGSWSTAKLSAILKNPIYVMADNSIYEYFSRRNANIVSDGSSFDGIHGAQIYGKAKHSAEDLSDIKVVVMTHEGSISSSNTNQINLLKNQISEIAREEEKLVDLLLNSGAGTDMMKLLNEKTEKLESTDTEAVNALHLAKKRKTASFEERKAVSKILIHKIFISEDGSVEIVWTI